ncbi:MAG: purine-nucleoside phosphorylase [bacterium]|nr:purine-nucleoside phosphorylase [bacterium]
MEKQKVSSGAKMIKQLFKTIPDTAIVTGTGIKLGRDEFKTIISAPFGKIPFAKTPYVEGHAGILKLCVFGGKKFILQEGRIHFYEYNNMDDAVYLVDILSEAGVKNFIFINSAGSLKKPMRAGSIMLISDHINLMGANPLLSEPRLGKNKSIRFLGLSDLYSKNLSDNLLAAAKKTRLKLYKGVYLSVSGPSYETRAEAKAFRMMGADAVGMSTVPEAMKAFSKGCKVAALSCITNHVFGKNPSNHTEIIKNANAISSGLTKLFKTYLKEKK